MLPPSGLTLMNLKALNTYEFKKTILQSHFVIRPLSTFICIRLSFITCYSSFFNIVALVFNVLYLYHYFIGFTLSF